MTTPTTAKKSSAAAAKKSSAKKVGGPSAAVEAVNALTHLREQLQRVLTDNTEMLKERTQKQRTGTTDPLSAMLGGPPSGLDAAASNREFWQRRTELDDTLRQVLDSVETDLLGWRKVFLLGALPASFSSSLPKILTSRIDFCAAGYDFVRV